MKEVTQVKSKCKKFLPSFFLRSFGDIWLSLQAVLPLSTLVRTLCRRQQLRCTVMCYDWKWRSGTCMCAS